MRYQVARKEMSFFSADKMCSSVVTEVTEMKHSNGSDWRISFRNRFPPYPDNAGFSISVGDMNIMILIANNGTVFFIGQDKPYNSDLYWIFSPKGERMAFKKLQKISIWCAAISDDGKVCCYMTDLNEKPSEDQVCVVLDCKTGNEVSRFSVADLFGHGVLPEIISISLETVVFDCGGFSGRTSLYGVLLDGEHLLRHEVKQAYENEWGYSLFYLSKKLPQDEELEALWASTKKKFQGCDLAKVYRRIGDIAKAAKHYELAVITYQQALGIDESVGCKRSLAKCQKMLELDKR